MNFFLQGYNTYIFQNIIFKKTTKIIQKNILKIIHDEVH